MSKDLNKLYDLKCAEGSLSWEECQCINRALVDTRPESIPEHQISNVCEYIQQVLLWQSAIPEYRPGLENILSIISQ